MRENNEVLEEALKSVLDYSSNNSFSNEIKEIIEFLKVIKEKDEILEKYRTEKLNFSAFYSPALHKEEITKYLFSITDNYDSRVNYLIYSFCKNIVDVIVSLEEFGEEDTFELLSDTISDCSFIMNKYKELEELKEMNEESNNSSISFLDKNKYKILFTGYSEDDIKDMSLIEIKQVLKKIDNVLSMEDRIEGASRIDHVYCLTGVPLMRVRAGGDSFRIAFLRKNDVTAIVGIQRKTGKDSDYSRYDPIAKKIDRVYDEIDLLKTNKLDDSSVHKRTVSYIENKLNLKEETLAV